MKLRNKKTGEIIDITCHKTGDFREKIDSLAELNEEWEDAPEEPKEYWFINSLGEAIIPSDTTDWVAEDEVYHKAIGNYFETREEAEKAVEKLKAWKRLKDKGLYFVRDVVNEGEYERNFVLRPMMDKDKRYVPLQDAKEIYNDIKLIFDLNIKEVKNE